MTGDLNVDDSILLSIKKKLGLDRELKDFDPDIVMAINTAFSVLYQLGSFGNETFSISGEEQLWSQIIPDGNFEMIKSFVFIRVKLLFDPPQSSFVLSSYKEQLKELEWRIYEECDQPKQDDS